MPFEILHIGDLDPHGQQIYSAVRDDVCAFLAEMRAQVEWVRLAVTPEQVDEQSLETEPETDNFQAEALPPDVLAQIVRTGIAARIDMELVDQAWGETEAAQAAINEALGSLL